MGVNDGDYGGVGDRGGKRALIKVLTNIVGRRSFNHTGCIFANFLTVMRITIMRRVVG